jgi:hypothetical protein
MALGKRGVVFTFIAAVFIAVLVLLYTFQQPQQGREKAFALETRTLTMNDILLDVSEDAERMLAVTTFRALIAMENDITIKGKFLDNVTTTFDELFFNGSINGTPQAVMANNTFPVWRDRMLAQASKIDVDLSLGASQVSIAHSSPWDVTGQFDLAISVLDDVTNASWNAVEQISGSVHIEQFEDPVYRLNTAGMVSNSVFRTNITDFVQGNDTTNLMVHTNNSYYRAWDAAPTYLDRFEGRLNVSSQYGIESLVNLQKLSDSGISIQSKSIVDHIYFSSDNPARCTASYVPAWWRLDNLTDTSNTTTHHEFYDAEGIVNPPC